MSRTMVDTGTSAHDDSDEYSEIWLMKILVGPEAVIKVGRSAETSVKNPEMTIVKKMHDSKVERPVKQPIASS